MRRYMLLMLWSVSVCINAAVFNPIIHADFSDPDIVLHDGVYYMVSSSFSHFPGVPVLTSQDGINWQRLNYVMPRHPEAETFAAPQHGKGMWAPCIRVHNGRFYVFMPDPDFGIYVASSDDPKSGWSEPHLLLAGKGIIDPTPLWLDGKAYLLHAWAKSRAGFNNVLTLHEMSLDAMHIFDKGKVVVDGNSLAGFRTLEGPKFYQHNGYFYIFAPAGGVKQGWQTVFRSRNIDGPYEYRITLEQGMTKINGPHQGAWVAVDGQDWFYHFQDVGLRGRILHRQPLVWISDWPMMGVDRDGNGVGEPVEDLSTWQTAPQRQLAGLNFNDNFDTNFLADLWQWHANPQSDWYDLKAGQLILNAQTTTSNLWQFPALISQMLVGPTSNSEVTIDVASSHGDITSGLVLFGDDYAWLGLRKTVNGFALVYSECIGAKNAGAEEQRVIFDQLPNRLLTLKVSVDAKGSAQFAYHFEGGEWQWLPMSFVAKPGRWVGARIGLFAQGVGQLYVDTFNQTL